MAKLLTVAAVLAAAYAAAGLMIFLSLDRLMYYPRKVLDAVPGDFALDAEEVSFAAADGVPLHGWYFPRPGSRAVLLFLHGNAGNISHRLPVVHLFQRIPADIFLFDYRGYGRSGGTPRGEELLLDAGAALGEARSRAGKDGKRVVLLGESIGGSIGLVLAAREKVDGIVTFGAFTSAKGVARQLGLLRAFTPVIPDRYDALGALGAVKAPVLFIHGIDDEVVPFSHGERLYAAAGEPKEFFPVEGAMHNDLFAVAGLEITARIGRFVEKLPGAGEGE